MKLLNKVMLVDDDNVSRFLHEHIIDLTGMVKKVLPFSGGYEAINYLLKVIQAEAEPGGIPDVVFLDLNMPGMDGWEFMEAYDEIMEIARLNTKVFILSASVSDADKGKAVALKHVSGFFHKPLTIEHVLDVVSDLDKMSQAEQLEMG